MTSVGLIGGPGVGKTALLTLMAKLYQEEYNYSLLTNYELVDIPYTYFDNIDDFRRLNPGEGNAIFIDEIPQSVDARRSSSPLVIEISHEIMQHRKLSNVMKPTHLFYSAQLINTVEYRIRSSEITNMIWKPKILAKDGLTGRPLIMSVEVYTPDKERIDEFKWRKKFYIPSKPYRDDGSLDTTLYDICDRYHTLQRIKGITDSQLKADVLKYRSIIPDELKTDKELTAFLSAAEPRWTREQISKVSTWIRILRKNQQLVSALEQTIKHEPATTPEETLHTIN